jgi:Tfp pilus assembly protein PilW
VLKTKQTKGLTLVELAAAVVITVLITGVALRIMFWASFRSEQIAKDSAYYQTTGRFLAQVRADLRSAVKVEEQNGNIILTLASDDENTVETVTFKIDQEKNRITRIQQQQHSIYDFGEPPENAGKLVFKIER